ncbi:MAG TPA: hypothetical protein DEF06_04750 [Clostridiales bacterium]|nr:hypothetical protein [Clostridiales bacterium]
MNMMLQAGNPITATKNFRFQSRSILLSRSSEITCSSSQRLFPRFFVIVPVFRILVKPGAIQKNC